MVKERKDNASATKGMRLKNESKVKTILYTDDQVFITKSEDKLQIAAHRSHNAAKKYNLKISTSKTKSMGMCGDEIRRLKTVTEGKITEHATEFNYLVSKTSEYKKNMEYKLQTQ
jgi:hypothetical protein